MRYAPPIVYRLCQLVLGLLAVTLLAGCFDPQPRRLTGSGMDMFGPTAMRIHPLTRLVPGQAGGQLEARLEFTDQMGDVGKAVGGAYFELYTYELAAVGHRGARVALWNSDISTPLLNKQQWDPITRTYLFRLSMPDPAVLRPGGKFVLTATMVFPNETRLHDELFLTVPAK